MLNHKYFSKSIAVIIGMFITVTGYAQQYNTTIRGNLPLMKPGMKIRYVFNDKDHMRQYASWDYVLSTDNGFTIKLDIPEGEGNEMILLIGDKPAVKKLTFIYADRGIINLNSKDSLFTDITLSGNQGARELNEFHQYLAARPELVNYEAVKSSAFETFNKKDAAPGAVAAARAQMAQLDSIRKVMAMAWISAHPASPVCAFIMHCPFEPLGNLNEAEKAAILNLLTPDARKNKIVTNMVYATNSEKKIAVGKPAPDFTQKDTLDRPVSLKDFRGKYVLLDFWASWCAPCRAENPNVVKAYNAYKNKGFTVLSVSLDQPGKKDAWLKAIHDDHLTWTHVSDLKFWGNAVAKLYNINAVPSNFLIGPDGTILAINVKGDNLEKSLAKFLN